MPIANVGNFYQYSNVKFTPIFLLSYPRCVSSLFSTRATHIYTYGNSAVVQETQPLEYSISMLHMVWLHQ